MSPRDLTVSLTSREEPASSATCLVHPRAWILSLVVEAPERQVEDLGVVDQRFPARQRLQRIVVREDQARQCERRILCCQHLHETQVPGVTDILKVLRPLVEHVSRERLAQLERVGLISDEGDRPPASR